MEKSLTAKEICSIIEACGKSKVRELSFGELKVSFSPPAEEIAESLQYNITQNRSEVLKQLEFTEEQQIVTDDEHRELLLVEDPVAFEEEMLRDNENTRDS